VGAERSTAVRLKGAAGRMGLAADRCSQSSFVAAKTVACRLGVRMRQGRT